MTRQDYIKIAKALRDARGEAFEAQGGAAYALNVAVAYLADVLGEDNPRFDRARFQEAAGYHT